MFCTQYRGKKNERIEKLWISICALVDNWIVIGAIKAHYRENLGCLYERPRLFSPHRTTTGTGSSISKMWSRFFSFIGWLYLAMINSENKKRTWTVRGLEDDDKKGRHVHPDVISYMARNSNRTSRFLELTKRARTATRWLYTNKFWFASLFFFCCILSKQRTIIIISGTR